MWISGKVQGVFFRKSTQEKARELNLTGWVKNLEDGRVQIWAQGEEDNLKKLKEWTHSGPDRANVEHVKVETREAGDYSDFIIDR